MLLEIIYTVVHASGVQFLLRSTLNVLIGPTYPSSVDAYTMTCVPITGPHTPCVICPHIDTGKGLGTFSLRARPSVFA